MSIARRGGSLPSRTMMSFSVSPSMCSIAMYVGAVRLAAVVDLDDVRMVQTCRGARLAREALDELGVLGVAVREHLDRDLAVQVDVVGEEDARHPAAAEAADDAVAPVEEAVRHAGVVGGRHRSPAGLSHALLALPRRRAHRSSASITSRAIGAAIWPPNSGVSSTTTAIATRGCVTGAKATNQAS